MTGYLPARRGHEEEPRPIPADIEAEIGVLGACAQEGRFEEAYAAAKDAGLGAEHFHSPIHKEIWRRIEAFSWTGDVDWLGVAKALEPRWPKGRQDHPTGFILKLARSYTSVEHVGQYVERIHETWRRRRALQVIERLQAEIHNLNGHDTAFDSFRAATDELEALTAGSATRQEMATQSARDFLGRTFMRSDGLVSRDILNHGDWILLLGEPKAGKSMLALDLACELVRDSDYSFDSQVSGGAGGAKQWCGFTVFGPARVLYMVGEGGEANFQKRLRKRASPLSATETERLDLWFPDPMLLDLLDETAFLRLRNRIVSRAIDVVILDPLAHFHSLDENSASEMLQVSSQLLRLRQDTGVSIVVVHHTRKPGPTTRRGSPLEGRGSTALYGASDGALVFEIEGDQGDPRRRVTFSLRNAEEELDPLIVTLNRSTLRFEVETTKIGRPRGKWDIDDICDLLHASGPMAEVDIRKAIGCGRDWLNKTLREARDSGVVRRTKKDPKPTIPAKWGLPHQIPDEEADFS